MLPHTWAALLDNALNSTNQLWQFGSYFGASLCAADLNGDQWDDLLVGAPMYMDRYDEGRVYVYMNREFVSILVVVFIADPV